MTTQRKAGEFEYTLRRNRGQRNLRLRLDPQGNIIVSAPYYASFHDVDLFVLKNSSWIVEHQRKVAVHTYDTGDFVQLLGENLPLMVLDGKKACYEVFGDKIVVTVPNKDIEKVKKVIRQLYTDTVMDILETRVPHWCNELGLGVPEYSVNRAKTKWGVCYPTQNRLCLTYACAILPVDLIDCTVLHEVCHLRVHGHGPAFWSLVERHMPDLRQRKARLEELRKAGMTNCQV